MNISCKTEKYIQKSAHSGLKIAMSSVLSLKKLPRISNQNLLFKTASKISLQFLLSPTATAVLVITNNDCNIKKTEVHKDGM